MAFMVALPETTLSCSKKVLKMLLKQEQWAQEVIEFYWPPRLDYLQKAGAKSIPSKVAEGNFPGKPSVEPNKVHDLHYLQFTELTPGAYSRLISGRGAQLSFLRMAPDSPFAHHIHPEEQLMLVLRGTIDEIILDILWPPRPDYTEKNAFAMPNGILLSPDGAAVLQKNLGILSEIAPNAKI